MLGTYYQANGKNHIRSLKIHINHRVSLCSLNQEERWTG